MNNMFLQLRWLLFLALLRMSYETANANRHATSEKSYLIESNPLEEAHNPREKEWTEKAVKKYADAQEKKWQRWHEAMFERLD